MQKHMTNGNLLGSWYVGTLLVPVKCRYVEINSNISPVITLANAIALISLSLSPPLPFLLDRAKVSTKDDDLLAHQSLFSKCT